MKAPQASPQSPAGFITSKEVRSQLGISPATLWRMMRAGTLAPVRSFRRRPLIFRRADVDALTAAPEPLATVRQLKGKGARCQ